jgi:ferrous iron transport protein B
VSATTVVGVDLDGGVSAVQAMVEATNATVPALISYIAFNMLTVPCFAAVATAKAELPSKKSFNWTMLFWIATSYVVSMAIYLIGTFWWTAFIFAVVVAAVVAGIVIYNKMHKAV